MENFRIYGDPPYRTVLLHGGPGAAGEMAPVAQRLAAEGAGVLEALQTAHSVEGQVVELIAVLEGQAALPAVVAGFSWGAWLALLTAARRPDLAGKLVLIGCGSLEEHYAQKTLATRLKRLAPRVRLEARRLLGLIKEDHPPAGENLLARLGELFSRTDVFDPLPGAFEGVEAEMEVYRQVWPQAAELRRSGELLQQAARVTCPVVALHGDFDPHPWQGVREPLGRVLPDFQFILLEQCGHKPWVEKQTHERFFQHLKNNLFINPSP